VIGSENRIIESPAESTLIHSAFLRSANHHGDDLFRPTPDSKQCRKQTKHTGISHSVLFKGDPKLKGKFEKYLEAWDLIANFLGIPTETQTIENTALTTF
jgi:hypothetical protein